MFPLKLPYKITVASIDITKALEELGFDVILLKKAVLAFSIIQNRAVLTLNRRDFFRLHRLNSEHCGIIASVDDCDRQRMARNINQAIVESETLTNQLIRVYFSY